MLRKEFAAGAVGGPKNASRLRVCLIVSRFNSDITDSLLEGALTTLKEWRVKSANIRVVRVPGAFEIPLACAKLLATRKKPDAIVALGCIIKGETKHDEYISHAVAGALQDLMLAHKKPIGFGIITPNTLEQAKARSRGETNHGASAARAALEMALVVN